MPETSLNRNMSSGWSGSHGPSGSGEAEGQHVLGVPASWIHPPRLETRAFRHPVHWWKWRRRVRREAPVAHELHEQPDS